MYLPIKSGTIAAINAIDPVLPPPQAATLAASQAAAGSQAQVGGALSNLSSSLDAPLVTVAGKTITRKTALVGGGIVAAGLAALKLLR